MHDYVVEILTSINPQVWERVYPETVSIQESLFWSNPTAATFEFDNNKGKNREKCALARQVRVTRNGVQIYRGVVQNPTAEVSTSKRSLQMDTVDYYRDLLKNKQTGPNRIWNYENLKPSDLYRSLIGTRQVIQEYFKNNVRIDETNCDGNLVAMEKTLGIATKTSGYAFMGQYQDSGTIQSKTLINADWATQGNIQATDATITGTLRGGTTASLMNNSGFDGDLTQGFIFTANASNDQLHCDTSFTMHDNAAVTVSSTGTLPAPLQANTTYWVKKIDNNYFQLRDVITAMTPINITTAGTGVHTVSWKSWTTTAVCKDVVDVKDESREYDRVFNSPADVTFARTGAALDETGASVAANTPRYVQTNLLPNETLNNINSSIYTDSIEKEGAYVGWHKTTVSHVGTHPSGYFACTQSLTLLNGDKQTWSIELYSPNGDVEPWVDGSWGGFVMTASGAPNRLYHVRDNAAQRGQAETYSIYIRYNSGFNKDVDTYFYWRNPQAERGSQMSPFAKPGTKHMIIEEGMTNLLTSTDFENGWSLYTTGGAAGTMTYRQDAKYGKVLRITKTDGGVGRYGRTVTAAGMSGAFYDQSVYVRALSATGHITCMYVDAQKTGGGLITSPTTANLSDLPLNQWVRIDTVKDGSPGTLSGSASVYVWADNLNGDVEFAMPQIELAKYTTTFMSGTRGSETLTIPASCINVSEGAVGAWVYVDNHIKDASANRYIFGHGTANSAGPGGDVPDRITLSHEMGGHWCCNISNHNGNGTQATTANDTMSVGWHLFVMRWYSGRLSLWIDDVEAAFATNSIFLPEQLAATASIGTWAYGAYGPVNTPLRRVFVMNKYPDDATCLDIYAGNLISGTSFYWPMENMPVPRPVMTRATTAYGDDGVAYANNIPRFSTIGGKKGLLIEEGTINKAVNPFFNGVYTNGVSTGWTRVGAPTCSENTMTTMTMFGGRSQRIQATLAGQGIGQTWSSMSLTPGTNYAVSAKIFINTINDVYGTVQLVRDGVGVLATSSGPGWQTLSAVITYNAGDTSHSLQILSTGIADFAVDLVQVEAKGFVTSFHDNTRNADVVTLKPTGLITPAVGTVEIWVNVTAAMKNSNTALFDTSTSANQNRITGYIDSGKWKLYTYASNGTSSSYVEYTDDLPIGWHHFGFRWSSAANEMAIVIDGTLKATGACTNVPSSLGTEMTIGCKYSKDTMFLNSLTKDMKLSIVARTNEEIKDSYLFGIDYEDANTTYVMLFEDFVPERPTVNGSFVSTAGDIIRLTRAGVHVVKSEDTAAQLNDKLSANLCANGDFEGNMSGWACWANNGSSSASVANDWYVTGTQSVKALCGAADTHVYMVYHGMTVAKGDLINVSVWVKMARATGGSVRVLISNDFSPWEEIASQTCTLADGEVRHITFSGYVTTNVATMRLDVYMTGIANGEGFYLDAVKLERNCANITVNTVGADGNLTLNKMGADVAARAEGTQAEFDANISTNLCGNPNFETNTAGWGVWQDTGSPTISSSNEWAMTGTKSMKVVSGAGGTQFGPYFDISCSANDVLCATFTVHAGAAQVNFQSIYLYDRQGGFHGISPGISPVMTANSTQTFTITGIVDQTGVCGLQLVAYNGGAAGVTYYVDNVTIEKNCHAIQTNAGATNEGTVSLTLAGSPSGYVSEDTDDTQAELADISGGGSITNMQSVSTGGGRLELTPGVASNYTNADIDASDFDAGVHMNGYTGRTGDYDQIGLIKPGSDLTVTENAASHWTAGVTHESGISLTNCDVSGNSLRMSMYQYPTFTTVPPWNVYGTYGCGSMGVNGGYAWVSSGGYNYYESKMRFSDAGEATDFTADFQMTFGKGVDYNIDGSVNSSLFIYHTPWAQWGDGQDNAGYYVYLGVGTCALYHGVLGAYYGGLTLISSGAASVVEGFNHVTVKVSNGGTHHEIWVNGWKPIDVTEASPYCTSGGFGLGAKAKFGGTGEITALKINTSATRVGQRIVDVDFSSVKFGAANSVINWTDTPSTGTVTVETSIDGGSSWQLCTKNQPIPNLTSGFDLTPESTNHGIIKVRQRLSSTDLNQPMLNSCTITVPAALASRGTWTGPKDSFAITGFISNSTIDWNTSGTIGGVFVDVIIDEDSGGVWQTNCTKSGQIAGLMGLRTGTHTIRKRVRFTGSGADTLNLLDITATAEISQYPANGNRVSILDLHNTVVVGSSFIEWVASNTPNTTVTVQTSIDGGSTWQTATNGATIEGLSQGALLTSPDVTLRTKVTLASTDNSITPYLDMLHVRVTPGCATSGYRISAPYDLNPINTVGYSTITWQLAAGSPNNANIYLKVWAAFAPSGPWMECTTNGGPIDLIPQGTEVVGRKLYIKEEFTSNGTYSPFLDSITWQVAPQYYLSGYRQPTVIDLTPVDYIGSSMVSWTPDAEGHGVDVSLNGTDWVSCYNNSPVPILSAGLNCKGVTLYWRETLTSDGITAPAAYDSAKVTLNPAYNPRGTITLPSIPLATAGTASSAIVTWDGAKVPEGLVRLYSSLDGVNWLECTDGIIDSIPATTDLSAKVLKLRADLVSTWTATPILYNITTTVYSRQSEYAELSTDVIHGTKKSGGKSLHLKCGELTSPWYGAISDAVTAYVTENTSYSVSFFSKGMMTNMDVHLEARNGSTVLGSTSWNLQNINDSGWMVHYTTYTTPATTNNLRLWFEAKGAGDLYIDDTIVLSYQDDVGLKVSRDNGCIWYDVPVIWNGAKWSGTRDLPALYSKNWDNHDISDLYPTGTGASLSVTDTNKLQLIAGSTDARARVEDILHDIGDFTAEFDVVIPSGGWAGMAYRTTYWGVENNSFAYIAALSTAGVGLYQGNDASSGSNNATLASAAPSPALAAGEMHHVVIVAMGNVHKIIVDNVQYVNYTDSTPPQYTTGKVGFHASPGCTALFDNFTLSEHPHDLVATVASNDFTATTGWTLASGASITTTSGGKLTLKSPDGITESFAYCTMSDIRCQADAGTYFEEHWKIYIAAKVAGAGMPGDLTASFSSAGSWKTIPNKFTVTAGSLTTANTQLFYSGNITANDPPTTNNASVVFKLSTYSTQAVEIDWVKVLPVENNRFKYRMTLNSDDPNHQTTPKAENIVFVNTTDSDTGIEEGSIAEFENPLGAGSLGDVVTLDLGRICRDDGIGNVQKLTGQDIWVDGNGKLWVTPEGGRGSALDKTFTVGKEISVLNVKHSREPMATALTLIGSGQISNEVAVECTSNQEDDEYIALYGRIEKVVTEKGLNDQGVVNLRCYQKLQQLKVPEETVTATIFDAKKTDWSVGDSVIVSDPTKVTGIGTNNQKRLRIAKASRALSTSGEAVQLEFTNINTDLKAGFESAMARMDDAMNTPQPTVQPQQVSLVDNCDMYKPVEVLLYIDETRQNDVLDILFFCYSRPFRSTSRIAKGGSVSTSITGGAHSHPLGDFKHYHGLPWSSINHDHTIAVTNVADGGTSNLSINLAASKTNNVRIAAGASSYMQTSDLSSKGGASTFTNDQTINNVSCSGGDHSHPLNISEHEHPLDFGIYEYNSNGTIYYAPCKLRMGDTVDEADEYAPFGIQGADDTKPFQVTKMSLLNAYATDMSKSLHPGVNFLYVCPLGTTKNPQGLIRLYVDVRVIYRA